MQRLSAGHQQSVLALLHASAHGAQIGGHGGDAVAFLDPQLARVADLDAILRVRPDRGQHRQLVDQRRRVRAVQ